MYIRGLLLLGWCPLSLLAQPGKILQDKDVLWAVEAQALIQFEPTAIYNEPEAAMAVALKTFQEESFRPSPFPFTKSLYELMASGRWPAFADAALSQPLPTEEAWRRLTVKDTIFTFDPVTYEETVMIIEQEPVGEAHAFLLRQLWYYNGKTNVFGTQALAIAPARKNGQRYQAVAWFQLPEPQAALFNLQSSQVHHAAFVKYGLAEGELRVLKGADSPLKTTLYKRLLRGAITGYGHQGEPIPASQIPELFYSRDTIITFDPEAYEERVEVVEKNYLPDDFRHYQIKQNWYFDPRQGVLQCRPEAVGPAVALTNEYGQLRRLMPLFYWKRGG